MKKYIIYKIQDGCLVEIQGPTKKRDGFLSIECNSEIRKIEDVDWEALKTQSAKDAEALAAQKQTCIEALKETQYIVDGDCDFPTVDILAERERRVIIKAIMRGSTIQTIPPRTFPSQ